MSNELKNIIGKAFKDVRQWVPYFALFDLTTVLEDPVYSDADFLGYTRFKGKIAAFKDSYTTYNGAVLNFNPAFAGRYPENGEYFVHIPRRKPSSLRIEINPCLEGYFSLPPRDLSGCVFQTPFAVKFSLLVDNSSEKTLIVIFSAKTAEESSPYIFDDTVWSTSILLLEDFNLPNKEFGEPVFGLDFLAKCYAVTQMTCTNNDGPKYTKKFFFRKFLESNVPIGETFYTNLYPLEFNNSFKGSGERCKVYATLRRTQIKDLDLPEIEIPTFSFDCDSNFCLTTSNLKDWFSSSPTISVSAAAEPTRLRLFFEFDSYKSIAFVWKNQVEQEETLVTWPGNSDRFNCVGNLPYEFYFPQGLSLKDREERINYYEVYHKATLSGHFALSPETSLFYGVPSNRSDCVSNFEKQVWDFVYAQFSEIQVEEGGRTVWRKDPSSYFIAKDIWLEIMTLDSINFPMYVNGHETSYFRMQLTQGEGQWKHSSWYESLRPLDFPYAVPGTPFQFNLQYEPEVIARQVLNDPTWMAQVQPNEHNAYSYDRDSVYYDDGYAFNTVLDAGHEQALHLSSRGIVYNRKITRNGLRVDINQFGGLGPRLHIIDGTSEVCKVVAPWSIWGDPVEDNRDNDGVKDHVLIAFDAEFNVPSVSLETLLLNWRTNPVGLALWKGKDYKNAYLGSTFVDATSLISRVDASFYTIGNELTLGDFTYPSFVIKLTFTGGEVWEAQQYIGNYFDVPIITLATYFRLTVTRIDQSGSSSNQEIYIIENFLEFFAIIFPELNIFSVPFTEAHYSSPDSFMNIHVYPYAI